MRCQTRIRVHLLQEGVAWSLPALVIEKMIRYMARYLQHPISRGGILGVKKSEAWMSTVLCEMGTKEKGQAKLVQSLQG
jgi:hypothetical protein